MQPRIAFCSQCRGMRLGWNKRYISHWLKCTKLQSYSRLGGSAIISAALLLCFPNPGGFTFSAQRTEQTVREVSTTSAVQPSDAAIKAEVQSIDDFLKRHQVDEMNRSRLAESIVKSAKKHDLNPKLLASIMIVESRGNPFAISGEDAIGIMQIHLPTWGQTADREDINLFKIEDNIDFGARILKDYVRRFGTWEGVKRYNGFIPGDPTWEKSAQTYLEKVQRIYGIPQPVGQPAAPQAVASSKTPSTDSRQPAESL